VDLLLLTGILLTILLNFKSKYFKIEMSCNPSIIVKTYSQWRLYFFILVFFGINSNATNQNQVNSNFNDVVLLSSLEENTLDEVNKNDFLLKIKEEISGSITDTNTGEPIPYVNIEIFGSLIGTSSNELGEFVLEIDSLPITIVFSHLNYERKVVEVLDKSILNIQLMPLVNSLNEVVLSVKGRDNYAFDLAKKAFSNIRKISDKKKYGRAFYRQKSKNGDDYSEFSEIIYDAIYTTEGIEKWEILEGRYALKREKINNSNFTLLSRILKSMQPDTDDLIFPLQFKIDEFYDVKIIGILSSQDGDIATLWFKPLENVIAPILDAEVMVNTKTHKVLKISGTVKNDHLKFIKFQEKNTYTEDYQLSYEMAFKKGSENDMLIDYIRVDHAFDYYKNDSFLTHVTSTSDLMFFEHYEFDKTRKIKNRFWKKGSDWEALNKIGYNEKFWEDNPIVKRTPVEDEVIASFEKNNAFESIFLNTKEQIAFMQSNLRGDVFIEKFDTTVRDYNNNNPIEKVFLHTDREVFVPGENIWYKAYVVLGEYHQYSFASKVLHVDLIDLNNKIVFSKTHKLDEGQGQGSIKLPSNLSDGNYQLRAYTNWMRNFDNDFFFTKTIRLLNDSKTEVSQTSIEDKINIQFFPEGGYAVNGIDGKITFKAIGSDGLGRKVKGQIKNSKGETVAIISSMYQGMGFFTLNPQPNEKYTAILDDDSKHELPKAQNEGYNMLVDNLDSKNIKVKIQTSEGLRNKPFYVIGTSNNNKQYQGKFKFNAESVFDFEIPKGKLPSGVMTLTLFDEAMRPWCERVLFINNETKLAIHTELDNYNFEKKNKFALKVSIKDVYGAPLSTNFSIAVTDTGKVEKDKNGTNILTHLLLQSDIKGYVENPNYFFSDDKRSTTAKLDLVMLTHGWRKFNWQELEQAKFDLPKEFSFKKGFSVSGKATNMQDVPLKDKELKMIAKSEDLLKLFTTKTNSDGSFKIDNIDNAGLVELAFNAYKSNGDQIGTKVTLLDTLQSNNNLPIPNFKNYSENLVTSNTTPFFVYEDAQILDEVLVDAKNKTIEKPKFANSLYQMEPDNTILADNNRNGNILFHIADIPGVNVDFTRNQVFVRGNPLGPLWVMDGMILGDSNVSGKIPDYIEGMDMSNIERIEVIKSASKAAVYGPSGKFGVIIIYTKTGKLQQDNSFTSKQTIQGFSSFKEFYSPKYDVDISLNNYPDNRTTLYWNPSMKTDKNGNATIIFYNSDSAKSFEVDIQALSEYGTPGAYLKSYKK